MSNFPGVLGHAYVAVDSFIYLEHHFTRVCTSYPGYILFKLVMNYLFKRTFAFSFPRLYTQKWWSKVTDLVGRSASVVWYSRIPAKYLARFQRDQAKERKFYSFWSTKNTFKSCWKYLSESESSWTIRFVYSGLEERKQRCLFGSK